MINEKYGNDMQEFIGQLVDVFEDYLTEKEISLFCDDRHEALEEIKEAVSNGDLTEEEAKEEISGLAIIYGSLYDVIGNETWYLNEQFDSMGCGNDSQLKEAYSKTFVDGILQSYRDVLERGRFTGELPKEDWDLLKEKVSSLYQNWVIGELEEEKER